MTPLAHAALAANQKTAKIAVKQKSCKEIDVSFYSMINGGVGFFLPSTYHHRCFLLLRHVQVGKENIDCKADHCTQKGDDAHEDEELGIGGEVSRKVHLEFLGFATCVDGWFMI